MTVSVGGLLTHKHAQKIHTVESTASWNVSFRGRGEFEGNGSSVDGFAL